MKRTLAFAAVGRLGAWLAILAMGAAAPAVAQPKPPDQHTEKVATEEPKKDNTISLSALLGGSLNTGNTQSWQLNVGSDFLLVRNPHSFAAGAQFPYGEANLPDDGIDEFEKTVGSLLARARYDFFLTHLDALFLAAGFRWDEFAGLDARVQGQVGYVRYFIRTDVHRFWGEVGYDATYDDYHPLPIFMDGEITGFTPNGHELVHSARLFAGYDNRLNEAVTYLGGLEGVDERGRAQGHARQLHQCAALEDRRQLRARDQVHHVVRQRARPRRTEARHADHRERHLQLDLAATISSRRRRGWCGSRRASAGGVRSRRGRFRLCRAVGRGR